MPPTRADCLRRQRDLRRARRDVLNPEVRQREQTTNTESRRVARTNPEVRQQEQTTNTESREGRPELIQK
jgi:hypothetical protein